MCLLRATGILLNCYNTFNNECICFVSQILDLTENEVKQMCRHLGYSLNIHESYYQQLDTTVEKIKVARLLTAMDNGTITNYIGKKMDEIDVQGITIHKQYILYLPYIKVILSE